VDIGATAAVCSSDGLGGGGVAGGRGPLGEGPLGASTSRAAVSDGCSHLSVAGSNTFTVLERAPNTYLPPPVLRRASFCHVASLVWCILGCRCNVVYY
jgi:hypothetical protein